MRQQRIRRLKSSSILTINNFTTNENNNKNTSWKRWVERGRVEVYNKLKENFAFFPPTIANLSPPDPPPLNCQKIEIGVFVIVGNVNHHA